MKRSIFAITLAFALVLPVLAQRHQTDREFDGLKGAVRSAVTKTAYLKEVSGKTVEDNLLLKDEITYDAQGNTLTHKTYNDGKLFESEKVSYIDGERLSLFEETNNVSCCVIIPGETLSKKQEVKPPPARDPRYTFKHEYKYDSNGNISKDTYYENNGALWMTWVYKRTGNRREDSAYNSDGSFDRKTTHVLDNKGNEIETIRMIHGGADSKNAYRYVKFDPKGNWTKRIESYGEADDPKSVKPIAVEYRTLTYF